MKALWCLLGVVGCGSNAAHLDATTDVVPSCNASPPAPTIVAGGGIANGPLACGLNVIVLDDITRQPIANASVGVGTATGTTDANGVFTQPGVIGPQTIYVKAAGYASAAWFGADGGNVTIQIPPLMPEHIPSAHVSGTVTGLGNVLVTPGHTKYVLVTTSIDDHLDFAHNYPPPGTGTTIYTCGGVVLDSCDFSFEVRAGTLALSAMIADYGPSGMTPVAWADHLDLYVVDGVDQIAVDLTVIDQTSYVAATIDFGTPPAGLSVGSTPGIDLGVDGILLLPTNTSSTTLSIPPATSFPNARYTLDAFAEDSTSSGDFTESTVKRRGFTGPTLSAGAWLEPPQLSLISAENQSWIASPDAKIRGGDFSNPINGRLITMIFDDRTQLAIPSVVAIADAHGQVFATGGDFDPTNFGFDRDRLAMSTHSVRTTYIPPSSMHPSDAGVDAAP